MIFNTQFNKVEDVVVIIPAYKPDKQIMLKFMEDLQQYFKNIVVIDDGSGEEYRGFFDALKTETTKVIRHNINLGKGRSIKTAFNYVLNEYTNIIGVVTADSDGQHYIDDIIKVANKLKEYPDKLILGSRNFNDKSVPFKSKLGNKLTRAIFRIFVGTIITDTQTGLRAFGIETIKKFFKISGERYEYETNMLIECKEQNIEIEEVKISTIYIRNNSLSHFDAIKDSMKIYSLFIKYIISALSSFILDILLFTLIIQFLPEFKNGIITEIVIATLIARVVSSLYNFALNSKVVFRHENKYSIIKYFALVILQMFISALAVSQLFKLTRINLIIIKITVDIIIFIMNFVIQREWVFKKVK